MARRTQSAASQYGTSHWMKPETLVRLPDAANAFDNNRDPSIPLQKAAMQKTESQRRREVVYQKMRGSKMVKDSKPHPALRPPKPLAVGPERAAFSNKWMEEKMRATQALLKDRNELTQTRQQIDVLETRNNENAFRPNSKRLSDLERQFYIQKRRAEHVMGQSQKHVQKFQRRTSQ